MQYTRNIENISNILTTEIRLPFQFKVSVEMNGSIGPIFLSFYETEIVYRYVYTHKNEMDPRANNVGNGERNEINVKQKHSSGPNKTFHSLLY
jgi:hypothetical protein